MFNEEEKEQLRKNLLNENEIKKIFGFLRTKIDQSESQAKQLISTYPNEPYLKARVAEIHRINNGFDVVFDLLEVAMKNISSQNRSITKMVSKIPSFDIGESQEEIKKRQDESVRGDTDDEFLRKLRKYYEKIRETTDE